MNLTHEYLQRLKIGLKSDTFATKGEMAPITIGKRESCQSGCVLVLVILVFVLSLELHCVQCRSSMAATPSAEQEPVIPVCLQSEADALNAIRAKWIDRNPQLSTHLDWKTNGKHPCDNPKALRESLLYELPYYNGIWQGVKCTARDLVTNATGTYVNVGVDQLVVCGIIPGLEDSNQCGFDGIDGEVPLEISYLTNLQSLNLENMTKLTGSVPIEIFRMPRVTTLSLRGNSLSGPLPWDVYNGSLCQLSFIDLRRNNFNGSIGNFGVNGTMFCPSLGGLYISNNYFEGSLNLENAIATQSLHLDISNNKFDGYISISCEQDIQTLDISNNNFTSIYFVRSTGSTQCNSNLMYLFAVNNKLSGLLPKEFSQMPTLTNLDISCNNFYGPIQFPFLNMTSQLIIVNVSNNNFNGTFYTGSFFNPIIFDMSNNNITNINFDMNNKSGHNYMPSLTSLLLNNNNLHGAFPSPILTSPSLNILNSDQNHYDTFELPDKYGYTSLGQIILTNNDIKVIKYSNNGSLSSSILQYSSLLFIGGNPICNKIENLLLSVICRFNQSSIPLQVILASDTKMKIIIATSVLVPLVFTLLVVTIYVRRLMRRIKSLSIILKEFEKKQVKPNLYSYKEIKVATNNFDHCNKLGKGGFGIVYKGELDGITLAVKKLTMPSHEMLSEFLNEIVVISSLEHRNLVKLKDCCLGDGNQRMLVFEYVENGNLAEALWAHGDDENRVEPLVLQWETRYNIICGIAKGVAYLHEDLESPIIHRDIKAANILLDKNYNPKIADFGLAYLFPALDNEESHLTLMQVAGTRGYWSPEYAQFGHISTSIDVFSFGIVVLEIVSGRRNIDLQKSEDESYLREWAWKQYQAQATRTLIDYKMTPSSIDFEVIIQVINVALACVHYKPSKRPKMHDVVSMLLGKMAIHDFSTGFEYGETLEDVAYNLDIASGTSNSLCSNKFPQNTS